MRGLIALIAGLLIAAATGIGSAWIAIGRGEVFGAVRADVWTAWPRTGSLNADPYAMAMLARTGELPLGASEGLAFTAVTDSSGEALVGTCAYRIAGETPAARMWTLTAYDDNGQLMTNPLRRNGFHAREVLRDPGGDATIAIGGEAAPGNWLPIETPDRFRLVLRLYDTPISTGSQIGDLVMPDVIRIGCR